MTRQCVRWKHNVVYSTFLISFLIFLSQYIDGNEAKSERRLKKHHYLRFKLNRHSHSSMSDPSSTIMSNSTFMTNNSFMNSFNLSDDSPNCRPIKSNATDNCFLTTAQIIERNGYCAETHQLTTDDGYRLQFFRLRKSCPRDCSGTNQPVVILVHGMLGSSSDFVFAGAEKGLGFQLMYSGFDVWLLNLRGNVYGGLQNKPGDFWDFSFHEMGNYDLPAYIDYILDYTRQDKLFYVGFSMGATTAYVLLSMRPDYNQKIIRMANMAPVVFVDHSEATIGKKMVVKINHWYEEASNSVKANGYPRKPITLLTAPECLRALKRKHCERFMVDTCSNKTLSHYDKELWDSFFRIAPAGGSSKVVAHYLQISQTGIFRPYSYIEKRNEELYQSKEPPPYELKNVRVPILLIIGDEDKFTIQKNIDDLRSRLISCPSLDIIHVSDAEFNHMDFFLAKDVVSLVFNPLIDYLKTGIV